MTHHCAHSFSDASFTLAEDQADTLTDDQTYKICTDSTEHELSFLSSFYVLKLELSDLDSPAFIAP